MKNSKSQEEMGAKWIIFSLAFSLGVTFYSWIEYDQVKTAEASVASNMIELAPVKGEPSIDTALKLINNLDQSLRVRTKGYEEIKKLSNREEFLKISNNSKKTGNAILSFEISRFKEDADIFKYIDFDKMSPEKVDSLKIFINSRNNFTIIPPHFNIYITEEGKMLTEVSENSIVLPSGELRGFVPHVGSSIKINKSKEGFWKIDGDSLYKLIEAQNIEL